MMMNNRGVANTPKGPIALQRWCCFYRYQRHRTAKHPREMNVLKRPLIASAVCLLLARIGTAQLVTNPIPAPVVKGSVRIRIDNLVQMPATVSTLGSKPDNSPSARARINFLRESPDGRLFVNDLRG